MGSSGAELSVSLFGLFDVNTLLNVSIETNISVNPNPSIVALILIAKQQMVCTFSNEMADEAWAEVI